MKIADILAEHCEEYDADCGLHLGCSCGWSGTEVVTDDRDWEAERVQYRDHLASIIEGAFGWEPTGWWRAVAGDTEGEPTLD